MIRSQLSSAPNRSLPGVRLSLLAIALCIGTTGLAKAQTVIDFDDLALGNFGVIPTNYKSFDPGTPNIAVGYRSYDVATNANSADNISFWTTGYGDLSDVGFAVSNGLGAEITLTPDAGFQITLESFDLAGFPETNLGATTLRLADGLNNAYSGFDYAANAGGTFTVLGTGPSHSTFIPNLTTAGTIRIQWGTNWNIGIDNVRFSQSLVTATVPEPGSVALLVLGAGTAFGVGMVRCKRRGEAA